MNSDDYLTQAKKSAETAAGLLSSRIQDAHRYPSIDSSAETLHAMIAYGRLCVEIAALSGESDQQ